MKYLPCVLFVLVSTTVYSQYYTRDAGILWGDGAYFNYRQFFNEEDAIEGSVGISNRGLRLIALKEKLQPAFHNRTQNLKLVYGYGVHTGVAYTNFYTLLGRRYYHEWQWTPQFGIDGLLGIDFITPDLPILISVAVQPYFQYSLNQYFNLHLFNFTFSVKYRF